VRSHRILQQLVQRKADKGSDEHAVCLGYLAALLAARSAARAGLVPAAARHHPLQPHLWAVAVLLAAKRAGVLNDVGAERGEEAAFEEHTPSSLGAGARGGGLDERAGADDGREGAV